MSSSVILRSSFSPTFAWWIYNFWFYGAKEFLLLAILICILDFLPKFALKLSSLLQYLHCFILKKLQKLLSFIDIIMIDIAQHALFLCCWSKGSVVCKNFFLQIFGYTFRSLMMELKTSLRRLSSQEPCSFSMDTRVLFSH